MKHNQLFSETSRYCYIDIKHNENSSSHKRWRGQILTRLPLRLLEISDCIGIVDICYSLSANRDFKIRIFVCMWQEPSEERFLKNTKRSGH